MAVTRSDIALLRWVAVYCGVAYAGGGRNVQSEPAARAAAATTAKRKRFRFMMSLRRWEKREPAWISPCAELETDQVAVPLTRIAAHKLLTAMRANSSAERLGRGWLRRCQRLQPLLRDRAMGRSDPRVGRVTIAIASWCASRARRFWGDRRVTSRMLTGVHREPPTHRGLRRVPLVDCPASVGQSCSTRCRIFAFCRFASSKARL